MKSWIESIPPDAAEGHLAELYNRASPKGEVDHILQGHSLVPWALDSLLVFYKRVMHGENDLPYVDREIIAVAVSVLNRCHY